MKTRGCHDAVVNPSTLRITDEKTLQLVQECEKQECLWNTHLVDYPNKEERLRAYEVIAQRLDIPNFTARHVRTKFKNLRNSYCQELKKIAADEKYKPKVMWFAYMDKYLKPHLQKIQSYTKKTKVRFLLISKLNIFDFVFTVIELLRAHIQVRLILIHAPCPFVRKYLGCRVI